MQPRIALVGASGYTGVELTKLLAGHGSVELAVASSDRWVGEKLADRAGIASALSYVSNDEAKAASCDVVMLATPAEVSHELVPQLLAAGRRVIDLSGAYRLRDADQYKKYYGFEHQHVALLKEAVYGLPERHRHSGARLVANPGCYATAVQLAIGPVKHLATGWIVDAMSGVTGAGRKATEEMSFAEVSDDFRAYRVLRHQHGPEIDQGLELVVRFTAHLLPVRRGILATCHATLNGGVTADDIAGAFSTYAREPFVSLAPSAERVSLHDVVGTNQCRIGWAVGEHGELVITSAIDNLVKGAAGQAVQNLNLMLGLPETTGLASLRSFHP